MSADSSELSEDLVHPDSEPITKLGTGINANDSEYPDNPFKDLSPGSSLATPESTVRASGSEGYLGDDDCDLSSTMYDESEDEKPLFSVSTATPNRTNSVSSSRKSSKFEVQPNFFKVEKKNFFFFIVRAKIRKHLRIYYLWLEQV